MPLLRRQPFHKQKPPPDLDPEEEVFHCKITNEIFRNYESFFERIILCNSLVWSCAITGRSGMTYQEAVECEEKAKKHLDTFQESLQRPLLFLASLTHRSRLVDLNDDVFLFAKDRYFIGETVDVTIGSEKKAAKVIKVLVPNGPATKMNGEVIVIDEDSDSDNGKKTLPDPSSIMYMVQPSAGKGTPVTVKASQVSRKKGLYTRDKSKLFLKQHCEAVMGLWTVTEGKAKKMSLKVAKFEDFFAGPQPVFTMSVIKKKVNKKVADPDTSSSFSATPERVNTSLNQTINQQEPSPPGQSGNVAKISEERIAQKEQLKQEKLAEKMAKREELKRKIEEEKQKKKEERDKEREKKREERRVQMEQLKEWSRPREDMECDDLKPLPEFPEVKTRLPGALFGDAVMVLEYINAFKLMFDFKQFFPKGFTWGMLESALVEADPEGPLCDLLQMLLCAIFNLQEEEAEEYQELEKEECEKVKSTVPAGDDEQVEEDDRISNNELIRSATVMAQYSQQTFGMPLRDTLLDQFTLTEVLRLHLLSSGARASSKNARFRYQQRGGYSSLDDPGLELRKQEAGLLKKLHTTNVFDFEPEDKLRLLVTLVQQVMTYAAVRDMVEESYDKLRLKKYDLKQMQWAEQRREREEAAAKYRRLMEERTKEREKRLLQLTKAAEEQKLGTPESKNAINQDTPSPSLSDTDPVMSPEEREHLEAKERKEEAAKKADFAKKELEMLQQIYELQRTNALCPLGRDRQYRRYWLMGSLPAVLVEDHELFVTSGLVTVAASSDEKGDAMPTLMRQDEYNTSSDKENELKVADLPNDGDEKLAGKCTNDDCIVISDEEGENSGALKGEPSEGDELPKLDTRPFDAIAALHHPPRWHLIDSISRLDHLMASLNPRGFRESGLHAALSEMRPLLNLTITSCPLEQLRSQVEKEEGKPQAHISTRRSAPLKVPGTVRNSSASEVMELMLRDMLLDLDDRIFAGSLGTTKLKDRMVWRLALENGNYDPQTDDPTFARLAVNNTDGSEGDSSQLQELAAKDLAHALVQVARGIEPRFLCPPLGGEDETKKKAITQEKQDESMKDAGRVYRVYDRWEESLLAACSLPQVFLHLAILDKSIKWDRSALLARCRICRRKSDGEKMLLCDNCDRGHHMYCLKPPMTKVPSGDWFCPDCRPKQPRPSPRKGRRRTFSEVSDEESNNSLDMQDTIHEASDEEAETSDGKEEVDDEDEEDENEDVCAECREDGKLILCDVCPRSYHLHCAHPPLKKVPRGKWMCQVCMGGGRAGKIQISMKSVKVKDRKDIKKSVSNRFGKYNSFHSVSKSGSRPGSRRDSPRDSPRNSPVPSSVRGRKQDFDKDVVPKSKGYSNKEITPKQKGFYEKDMTPKSRNKDKDGSAKLKRTSSTSRLSQESSDFETNMKQYMSSKRGNTQVQHLRACEDLLQELIRHPEAWPFLKPVDKKLVPDYYDVISNPMDLSTIRNKVHKYEYTSSSQLLDDMRLIFTNCVEYNARTTPEYRAGQTLSKFFQTRLREMGLQEDSYIATPPPSKKQCK